MDTPIADFIDSYTALNPVRLHMPGHKGELLSADITEIPGADVLYKAGGIIAGSEANASRIFGTGLTLYSTEGATLAIRAMLLLLYQCCRRKTPLVAAGRNAHVSFYTGAALSGIDVIDIYPGDDGYIDLKSVREAVDTYEPDALFLTSPDYEGRIADIRGAADIAHKAGIPLLVDNAHGAYLKFLTPSAHPIDLGADITADSAHKTLPALTGGAYLHIARGAPKGFIKEAERALAVFASTSPSYLILRSLDEANRLMADGWRDKVKETAEELKSLKKELISGGWKLIGDEPLKLTLDAASFGYTGKDAAMTLAEKNIYAEAYDSREVIMMFSPFSSGEDIAKLREALGNIKKRPAISPFTLSLTRGEKVIGMREAMLSRSERVDLSRAPGKVLSEPVAACPPGVPIALPGELIGEELIKSLRYLGIGSVSVMA